MALVVSNSGAKAVLATGVDTRWGRSGVISSATPLSPVLLLEEERKDKGLRDAHRGGRNLLCPRFGRVEQESVSSSHYHGARLMTATFILRDTLVTGKHSTII